MATQLQHRCFSIDDSVHGTVTCAELVPRERPRGACLFLYGGGGSAAVLEALQPLLETELAAQRLPSMVFTCAQVPPFCFYLDDLARGMAWESLVAKGLVAAVRQRHDVTELGLVGNSMGGYGALKIAFSHPGSFAAVAAVAPMLEPDMRAHAVPLRNRFHYPAEVPQALLGSTRDAELFERDHPATRARQNTTLLKTHAPAIWIDAGSRDACHAHDGAEFLHRVLWQLDIAHEYHLLRDADHVGPSIPGRLLQAFRWVGERLYRQPCAPSAEEHALRTLLAPARAQAETRDPTIMRTYGQAEHLELHIEDGPYAAALGGQANAPLST